MDTSDVRDFICYSQLHLFQLHNAANAISFVKQLASSSKLLPHAHMQSNLGNIISLQPISTIPFSLMTDRIIISTVHMQQPVRTPEGPLAAGTTCISCSNIQHHKYQTLSQSPGLTICALTRYRVISLQEKTPRGS